MSEHYGQDEQKKKDEDLVKELWKKQEKLEAERRTYESNWQECLDYIVPRKGDILSTRTPGGKRGAELFDTTSIMANQTLAAALHGMLTNPAVKFFDLVMGDPSLDDSEEVKSYLQECAERMFVILNNSNFQTEVHELYIDEGAIGTGCMYMGEHDERVIHFGARPMKEIFIDENNLGLIDTVHRKFQWKPRQIIQEFGEDKLNPWVVDKYKQGCDDNWDVLHIVHPMSDDEAKQGGKGHKFKSLYVLKEKPIILSKSGFYEFPYAVPRWTKTSGEKYGRGPGTEMLPDIKMVNEMMRTTLEGAQTTIRPPLMVTDDGVIGNVRLTPAGVTVVRQGNGEPAIRPLITDARVDFGYQAVDDVRKRIRAGFFVDQLRLNEGPQMTAQEVMQRTEENLRLMGPILGRQHFEFLDPLITRLFGIMIRKNLLPPAPKAIHGRNFNVRFSSLVARAQRMSEAQNFSRAISVASPILQVKQDSLDIIDGDKSLRYIFDIYGIPNKVLASEKEVKNTRDARAQQQQQMMQQQQEAHKADMISKVMPGIAQVSQAEGAKK
jgi:hypothetical protein